MSNMNIDLAQMSQFFRGMENICNSFCENQQHVDRAFNTVQETWRDKNAVFTCDKLKETAYDISKFYVSLNEAIEYVVRVCNNRADYIDYERFSSPQISQFTSYVMEITTMDNSVIKTDPSALEEFKSSLDKYIQSIIDNVEHLNKIYRDIGSSWNDSQYDRFGDAISDFAKQMQSQLDVLCIISGFLKDKIEILRRDDI